MTMHALSDSKFSLDMPVPAFLNKLWMMVNEPETNSVIGWTSSGTEFYIRNHALFYTELLPVFYKHNNLASFIRQLNMYGFKKMSLPMSGGMRSDSDEAVFYHASFVRGRPHLLREIQRKRSHARLSLPLTASDGEGGIVQVVAATQADCSSSQLKGLYSSVQQLQKAQTELAAQLAAYKAENETLWREVVSLRHKDSKHENAINKLIQFIVPFLVPQQASRAAAAAAGASSNIGVKRKQLPMLGETAGGDRTTSSRSSDTTQSPAKLGRVDRDLAGGGDGNDGGSVDLTGGVLSPDGPIIQDVTDLLMTNTTVSPAPQPPPVVDRAAICAAEPVDSSVGVGPVSDAVVPVSSGGSSDAPNTLVCDALLGDIHAELDSLAGVSVPSSCGGAVGGGELGWYCDPLPSPSCDLRLSLADSHTATQPQQQQQLMPYSPSVYELLSTANELFPDLHEMVEGDRATASPPASLPPRPPPSTVTSDVLNTPRPDHSGDSMPTLTATINNNNNINNNINNNNINNSRADMSVDDILSDLLADQPPTTSTTPRTTASSSNTTTSTVTARAARRRHVQRVLPVIHVTRGRATTTPFSRRITRSTS